MRVGGEGHAPAALPRERDPVRIVQETRRAAGPVWTAAQNPASTGIYFVLFLHFICTFCPNRPRFCLLSFTVQHTHNIHPCPRRKFFLFSVLYLYFFVLIVLTLPFVLYLQNTHKSNIHAPGGIQTRNPSK